MLFNRPKRGPKQAGSRARTGVLRRADAPVLPIPRVDSICERGCVLSGSTPCEVNGKDGQPKLSVLTYFGGPSGGQPAAQAAAAALCALRAALVNAHAFPQLRAPTGSTPCEVNKKDGQLSLTVLTCFGWAVRGSACCAGGRCGALRLARYAGKCLRISSAPRPDGFDPMPG